MILHQEFEPPEELRNTIKCFWYNKRELGGEPSSFEVLPDGYPEIIFHFGSGCFIFNNGQQEPLPSPFIMGLHDQPVHFYTKNSLEIIGIRCFPWTVFDLLQLSSCKGMVPLLEHPIAQLQSTLSEFIQTHEVEKALESVKQYFINNRTEIAINKSLAKAGAALREAKGTIPVSEVAAAAHTTVRTLERNFKQSSGHTIKDVSALIRFEQVRNFLWLHPDTNLAGLAYDLGYTDQSHLTREFKRYSCTTPRAFAKKVMKAKQKS
jgi:AraC-like DNA-binding protein